MNVIADDENWSDFNGPKNEFKLEGGERNLEENWKYIEELSLIILFESAFGNYKKRFKFLGI